MTIKQIFYPDNWAHFKDIDKTYIDKLLFDYNDPNKPTFLFSPRKVSYNKCLIHNSLALIICNSSFGFSKEEFQKLSNVFLISTSLLMTNYIKNTYNVIPIEYPFSPIDLNICNTTNLSKKNKCVYFYAAHLSVSELKFYGYYRIKNIIETYFPEINLICCCYSEQDNNGLIKPPFKKHTRIELENIYNKCFLGIRLTPFDGTSDTVQQLGLRGVKTIWNGGYPSALSFECDDHIIKHIEDELKFIGQPNEKLAIEVREFLNPSNYSYIFDENNYKGNENKNILFKKSNIPKLDCSYFYDIENILLNFNCQVSMGYMCYIYHNNIVKYNSSANESQYKESNTKSRMCPIYYPTNGLIIKIDKIIGNNGNLDFNMQIFGIKYLMERISHLEKKIIIGNLKLDSNIPIKIYTGTKWIHHNKSTYDDIIEITNINEWWISPSNEFLQDNIGKTDVEFIINNISFQLTKLN